MDDGDARSQVSERLSHDPVITSFLSPFRRLAEADERDLEPSFERFGQAVGRAKVTGRVVFRVAGADKRVRAWSLELTPGSYKLSAVAVHRPDLEVLVGERTWRQLAEGAISPLDAFATGEMRVLGNIRLAAQLAELAGHE